ncbi:hypothetical protein C8J57DRAFT_1732308 [Mycena rebaudengoi]|nr:hypothetical protein C8J57DRAFT_1732308 [Mycena rebaudengoi]
MISLLLLVHTLSGHNLSPRATLFTDSCDDINNCRKLLDIVWGCLGPLALLWHRLKLMLVAIIAPELMVGFAARQFFVSRWYAKEHKISKTHGFFISMGGFVSHVGHHPVTTPDDVRNYLDAIRAVDVEDIKDKSKGDALSKCFARLAQNLPISELEVATLAFAVVNVFIWLLWWNKPLDVQRPIMVMSLNDQHTISPLGVALKKLMTQQYTSVPSFWFSSGEQDNFIFALYLECLIGAVFGAIHCAAWNANFASTIEMWMWRSCTLSVTAIPPIVALVIATVHMGLDENDLVPNRLLEVIMLLAALIYTIARLFLIVLPLISLRAPAVGSLVDVNWTVYIPHL